MSVTLADVEATRARLRGVIHETPCAFSQSLSDLTGARVFVKLENLQMTAAAEAPVAPRVGAGRSTVAGRSTAEGPDQHHRAIGHAPRGDRNVIEPNLAHRPSPVPPDSLRDRSSASAAGPAR